MNMDAAFLHVKILGQVDTKPGYSKIVHVPTFLCITTNTLFAEQHLPTLVRLYIVQLPSCHRPFENFPFPRGKLLPFSRGLTTVYKALFLLGHSDIINSLFALLG